MSLTVYDHPLSPYGQKVKIALMEKGVEFSAVLPDAIGSGLTQGAFQRSSPRGEVPALVDEQAGVALFDSSIILAYIEEQWPQPALLPAEPHARAQMRTLEEVMDTHFEAITWGLSELQNFGRGDPELAAQMRQQAMAELHGWYAWLTRALDGGPWFNGAQFGWGDICVVPFVNGAVGFGAVPDGELGEWLDRVNARESVATVTAAAQAVAFDSDAVSLEEVRAALEQGLFKREYRDHRLEWMVRNGGLQIVEDGLVRDNIRFTDVFQ